MNKKSWVVFGVIITLVVGGIIYLGRQTRLDVSDLAGSAAKPLNAEKRNGHIADRVYGDKDAALVLIEYGDYQCGGCRTVSPEAKRVADTYKKHVALVFRNYLIPGHHNARAAAAAAEAAGQQGKFWPMHELLYEKQAEWSNAKPNERAQFFAAYARQLKLDEAKFATDIADKSVIQKIDFDVAIAKLQHIEATPSFYLNGERITMEDTSSIEKAVKEALQKKGISVD